MSAGKRQTSRERLAAAMEGRPYDRVPFMCQMSIGHMLLQLGGPAVEFWHDAEVFAQGLVRLQRRYGFDGVLVSLHGHDPEWRTGVVERSATAEGERVAWRDGSVFVYPPDDLPRPLTGPHDDGQAAGEGVTYIPVSQGLRFPIDPRHPFDVLRRVRQLAGPEVAVHGEVTSPFDYLLDALGHENALMMLMDDPPAAEAILDRYASGVSELASRMCREDIDAVKISSPFAGAGFLSPDHYAQFVLPYEGRIVEAIQSTGRHAYLHTCGAIGDRLALMQRTGAHGLECLDPPPLGTVELDQALRTLNGSMFVKGNVDPVNTLLLGTDESVLTDARRRVQLGRRYGRFILSTACSIAPGVPAHRIDLLRKAVEEESLS